MDTKKAIEQINQGRDRVEAQFVFSLWNDPELYQNYARVNQGKDRTIRDNDAKFYFYLGRKLYEAGYRNFDHVTLETFLEGYKEIRKEYENRGGWKTVDDLKSIVNPNNIDAVFDKIAKMNNLTNICEEYEKKFSDPTLFESLSNDEVYTLFESINSNASITSGNVEQIEDLTISDEFVEHLKSGEDKGYSYSTYCPSLSYITMGAKPGSLYLVGGYSGTGKTSWVFQCMLMGLHAEGVKVAIISNEMKIDTYRILLLEHVLVHEFKYYGLPRKSLRTGKFGAEQEEMVRRAQQVINENYNDIKFVKLFDNNIEKIMMYMKRLKSMGVSVIFYDTFKADDNAETDSVWQSLMFDARKIFQCASKLDICCITTYQLALHAENTRYLTASCLSNSKQIKEIYETMIYMRPVWDDEKNPTSKNYIRPYRFDNGIKRELTMSDSYQYILVFVDKNRADEDKQVLLYQWKPSWNEWLEVGYAKVLNDHGIGKR